MKQLTDEDVRAVGGIIHRDGNVFFTNVALLNKAIELAQQAQPEPVLTDKEQIATNKRELLKQMQAQPERAPLSDDEIIKIGHSLPQNKPLNLFEFARAIEAAHGIRQGGQHD